MSIILTNEALLIFERERFRGNTKLVRTVSLDHIFNLNLKVSLQLSPNMIFQSFSLNWILRYLWICIWTFNWCSCTSSNILNSSKTLHFFPDKHKIISRWMDRRLHLRRRNSPPCRTERGERRMVTTITRGNVHQTKFDHTSRRCHTGTTGVLWLLLGCWGWWNLGLLWGLVYTMIVNLSHNTWQP